MENTTLLDELVSISTEANREKAEKVCEAVYGRMKIHMTNSAKQGRIEFIFDHNKFPELYGNETYHTMLMSMLNTKLAEQKLKLERYDTYRDGTEYRIKIFTNNK